MRFLNVLLILVCLCFGAVAYPYSDKDGEGPGISKSAEALLKSKDFDALEKTVAAYRKENKKVTGGNSALYHFYPGVGGAGSADVFAGSLTPNQRYDLLNEWSARKPSSVTARIALAKFWDGQGWEARGDGYASTVSEDRWKVFQECRQRARDQLRGLDPTLDPMVYYLLIDLASTRVEIDTLYQKAIAVFPDYVHYYTQYASALEEKWYGKPGELAFYAHTLLKKPGAELGSIAYSYVAATFLAKCDCDANQIFRELGFQWQPLKEGFDARLQKYGLRNRDWNAYAYLAALSGNAADARAALAKVSDNWDPIIWKSRDNFVAAREWARTHD